WTITRQGERQRSESACQSQSIRATWLCYRRRSSVISWIKRYDMTPTTAGLLILLWVFFIGFILYPLVFVFSNAFFTAEGFSLVYFKLMMTSPNYTTILSNRIILGLRET